MYTENNLKQQQQTLTIYYEYSLVRQHFLTRTTIFPFPNGNQNTKISLYKPLSIFIIRIHISGLFYNLAILSCFDIWLQAYNDKLQI